MPVPKPLAVAMARGFRRALDTSRAQVQRTLAARATVLVAAGGPSDDLPPGHIAHPETIFDSSLWEASVRSELAPVVEATVTDAASRSAVGYAFDVTNPRMGDAVAAHVDAISSWGESFRTTVADTVKTGMNEGWSNERIAASLGTAGDEAGPLSDARAMAIARSESTAAANAGTIEGWRASNGPDGNPVVASKTWLATGDDRTRETHADADGQEVGLDETFSVGDAEAMYPGDPDLPPEERINCVLPWISVSGLATATMLSDFDGECVWLTAAGGYELAATPDHPVLTRRGWRTVGSLKPGDEILCAAEARSATRSAPHPADGETSAEEAFAASKLAAAGRERIASLVVDLDSDVTDREVHVQGPHDPLSLGLYAEQCEQLGKLLVPVAHREVRVADHPSAGLRALHPEDARFVARSDRKPEVAEAGDDDVSSDPEVVGDAFDGPEFVLVEPSDVVEEMSSSVGPRRPNVDARFDEAGGDHRVAHSVSPRESGGGLATLVRVDDLLSDRIPPPLPVRLPAGWNVQRVTSVTRRRYEGKVYDLSTPAGLYLAGGIVSHNCRCTMLSGEGVEVSAEDAEEMDSSDLASILDSEPGGGLEGEPPSVDDLLDEAGTDLSAEPDALVADEAVVEAPPVTVLDQADYEKFYGRDDFRMMSDLDERATALWQYTYQGSEPIRAIDLNLRAGKDAFDGVELSSKTEAVLLRSSPLEPVRGSTATADAYGVPDLRRDLEAAAVRIGSALDAAPPTESELFRGMWMEGEGAPFSVGDSFDRGLTSFTSDQRVTNVYARQNYGAAEGRAVMVELESGTKAVPLEPWATSGYEQQREWLASGKFEVTEVRPEGERWFVRIRQVEEPRPLGSTSGDRGAGRNAAAANEGGGKRLLTLHRNGEPVATHLPFAVHPSRREPRPIAWRRPQQENRVTATFVDSAPAPDSIDVEDDSVETEHTGAMVALYPTDPSPLVVDGGDPPEELHVTLGLLGEAADLDDATIEAARAAVEAIAGATGPFDAFVAGGGTLGDGGAVVLFLEAGEINDLADAFWSAVDRDLFPEQHEGFLPHLTLGYGIPLDATLPFLGTSITLSTMALAVAGAVDPYPLGESVSSTDTETDPAAPATTVRRKLGATTKRAVYVDDAAPAASGTAASGTDSEATVVPLAAAPPAEPIVVEDLGAADEMAFTGLLVVEGIESGDERLIADGALTWRELPLPLMAMFGNPDGGVGHAGAAIAGRIDLVWRDEERPNELRGSGVFDTSPAGEEAYRLLKSGMLRGVSVDLDNVEVEFESSGDDADPLEALFGDPGTMVVTSARIMGATMTAFPAFAEAHLEVVEEAEALAASAGRADYVVVARFHSVLDAVGGLVASGGLAFPAEPPAEWFEAPDLAPDDRVGGQVRVDLDGRVYGYLAKFGDCHIGFGDRCVTVPKSRAAYSTFRTGRTVTAEGDLVPTGPLTTNTVHPDLALRASDAAAFYSDSGCAAADVTIGEDSYGVWVAGSMRPGASAEQLRALRGGGISGDWRPIRGNLELVAVLAVNCGGFSLGEALAASAGTAIIPGDGARGRIDLDSGEVTALVAAGRDPRRRGVETSRRLDALTSTVEELSAVVRTLRADRARTLAARLRN